MGNGRTYFISKLSELNSRMIVHEGDARTRLVSEADNIFVLPIGELPEMYKHDYNELLNLIINSYKNKSIQKDFAQKTIKDIRNITAVKYIKLLLDIENRLREEED
jgi:hypothetical protein